MQVTTIIPVHNTPDFYLRPTLDSVAVQTVSQHVILVDDASDFEDTRETLQEYSERYGWKLIRMWRRKGVARARNAGLKHVKTPYTAICDSDDLWHPEKLEQQLSMIGGKGACICGTVIDYRNGAGYPLRKKSAPEASLYPILQPYDFSVVADDRNTYRVVCETQHSSRKRWTPRELISLLDDEASASFSNTPIRTAYARLIRFNASLCGSNTLFNTDDLRRTGGFNPKYNGADEWDALLNVVRDGGLRIAVQPLCFYVRRNGSFSVTNLPKLRTVCEKIIHRHRMQLTDEERVLLQSVETAQWAADFEKATFLAKTPYKIIQYGG